MTRIRPLVFLLLAAIGCAPPPPSLPPELAASRSDAELLREHGFDELVALEHPDYPGGFYCAWASRPSGDFVDYEIGFYARTLDSYRLLDDSHIIGGFGAPHCGEIDPLGEVGAIAPSLADGEEIYLFIEDGQMRSTMEHEDAWTEIGPGVEQRRRQGLEPSE